MKDNRLDWMRPGILAAVMLLVGVHTSRAQFGGGGGGGAAGRATTSTAREYPSNTEVGEAMITSDPQTRNLIVITDDETNENIKQVIQSLDRPKPQVLINVVFLQVTHNNELDFGVEGQYTHTSSSDTQTGGTDFGLAAAQAASGGGFYKFVSDDVDLMIRALQVQGKTEILSRPTILARNNQLARIIVGQQVPLISNSRVTDTGQTVNTLQYQDIGIILNVTPFITSDNMVEMIISPQISNLSDQTVPISDTASQPVIDIRSADTVVLTPSGKTIVIGGLIASQNIEQERKVPILGDIPLLGYAFKRMIKKDTRSELIIFLTPTVIQHPMQLAEASSKETQKLDIGPKAFDKGQLNRFIEGYDGLRNPPEADMGTHADFESESARDLHERALQYLDQKQRELDGQP